MHAWSHPATNSKALQCCQCCFPDNQKFDETKNKWAFPRPPQACRCSGHPLRHPLRYRARRALPGPGDIWKRKWWKCKQCKGEEVICWTCWIFKVREERTESCSLLDLQSVLRFTEATLRQCEVTYKVDSCLASLRSASEVRWSYNFYHSSALFQCHISQVLPLATRGHCWVCLQQSSSSF